MEQYEFNQTKKVEGCTCMQQQCMIVNFEGVFAAAGGRCTTSFNSSECVNWKTAPSVLGTDLKLRHVYCCNYMLRGRSVIFLCHCSFAIKFWTILIFLSMACSENLLNQICLIDRALTYKCASASFIVWRNIYAFLCFHFFPLKFSSFCGKIFNDLVVFPNGFLCCFFFAFACY